MAPLCRIARPVRGKHRTGNKLGIAAARRLEPWTAAAAVTPARKIAVGLPQVLLIVAPGVAIARRLGPRIVAAIAAVAAVEIG